MKRHFKFKFLVIILFLFLNLAFIMNEMAPIANNRNEEKIESEELEDKSIKLRASWTPEYILNFSESNWGLNGTRHYSGTNITIEGFLYDPLPPPIKYKSGVNVSVVVDNEIYREFSNKTGSGGFFKINFTIPNTLNVNKGHKIQVNVTDDIDVLINHHYTIYVNTTSYFQGLTNPSTPYLGGENFTLTGGVLYENGTIIKNANISRYWYQGDSLIVSGSFLTDEDGGLPIFIVPNSNAKTLNLKLNFTSPPEVNYSETQIEVKVFSNITCYWDITESLSEGDDIDVRGYITSSSHPSLKINNRDIRVYYDGDLISTDITDSNGTFSLKYTIPNGTGLRNFKVEIVNYIGKNIISKNTIEIETTSTPVTPAPPGPGNGEQPWETFLLYFIPIIISVGASLTAGGYLYYRRLKLRSMFVNIPLAPKIRNFKILKDTGRIEEAITYLFKAIYMELINGKYGRVIQDTETIRDFAIVCVKSFMLNPTSIYPFIQNIEKVIYGKPLEVPEEAFHKICDLFSPVYFDLTGYDFILNF